MRLRLCFFVTALRIFLGILVTKIRRLKAFRDPTQFGNHQILARNNSPFEQIFELTYAKELTRIGQYRDEFSRDGILLFIRTKFVNLRSKTT